MGWLGSIVWWCTLRGKHETWKLQWVPPLRQAWWKPMPRSHRSFWWHLSFCAAQSMWHQQCATTHNSTSTAQHYVEHAQRRRPHYWRRLASGLLFLLWSTWSACKPIIWTNLWRNHKWREINLPICSSHQIWSLRWQHHHVWQDKQFLAQLEHAPCWFPNSVSWWRSLDWFQAPTCQQQVQVRVQSHRQDQTFMAKSRKTHSKEIDWTCGLPKSAWQAVWVPSTSTFRLRWKLKSLIPIGTISTGPWSWSTIFYVWDFMSLRCGFLRHVFKG